MTWRGAQLAGYEAGQRRAMPTALVKLGREWAEMDREDLRKTLVDPVRKKLVIGALDTALAHGNARVIRLYFELLGMVGSEGDVLLEFIRSLGYTAPIQLASDISRLRGVESMDADALLARAEKFVREEYARRGKAVMIVDSDKEVDSVADPQK